MKAITIASLALVALVGSTQVLAQARSRDEVKAELAEARRSGNLLVPGEAGLPLNQLLPNLYPSVPPAIGKTTEEARRELAEALRSGEILAGGELVHYRYEERPDLYPQVAAAPGKTREGVKAELFAAIATGDVIAGGELGLKQNELNPQHFRTTMLARNPLDILRASR